MKRCTVCKEYKELKKFNKNKSRRDGYDYCCKKCKNDYSLNNKERISKREKEYHKKYPWIRVLKNIKKRCNDSKNKFYKNYGGRGIENHFKNADEIKFLWFRDKAWLLRQPSIDRKDNDGNYCIENCRFIEKGQNSAERNRRASSKVVLQYDLDGNFIKEWKSVVNAASQLKVFSSNISACALGIAKTSNGFIWRYKKC